MHNLENQGEPDAPARMPTWISRFQVVESYASYGWRPLKCKLIHEAIMKQDIRKALRRARQNLTEKQHDSAAFNLYKNLRQVKLFNAARRISLYCPNDGEIDPALILNACLQQMKKCYFPVLYGARKPRLLFRRIEHGTRLAADRMGIFSPLNDSRRPLTALDMDIILLPLVAFDAAGSRIGMGGGFYDASLAFLSARRHWMKPRLIGIAHELQKIDAIKADTWDVPIQTIVTDRRVYHAA